MNLTIERLRGGWWGVRGATKIEQVERREEEGSKFEAFCDNVIIECLLKKF